MCMFYSLSQLSIIIQIQLHGFIYAFQIKFGTMGTLYLKGKFSSGREGALASKFNYDFK